MPATTMPSFPTLWKWIFSGSDAAAWTCRSSLAPNVQPAGQRIWTRLPNWKRCWRNAERNQPTALEDGGAVPWAPVVAWGFERTLLASRLAADLPFH